MISLGFLRGYEGDCAISRCCRRRIPRHWDGVNSFNQSDIRLSLSELPITDTELKLIAAAAIIGLNSKPKNG